MGNKKSKKRDAETESAGTLESLGKKLDEIPAVQSAEAALRKARQELDNAEQSYREARAKATEQMQEFKNKNVGEIVDSTLGYVQRHPAQGLFISALLGFFLGRMFRR